MPHPWSELIRVGEDESVTNFPIERKASLPFLKAILLFKNHYRDVAAIQVVVQRGLTATGSTGLACSVRVKVI